MEADHRVPTACRRGRDIAEETRNLLALVVWNIRTAG